MYHSKPNRPHSRTHKQSAALTISTDFYEYQAFPKESPFQPGDAVSVNGKVGTVLEDGAYLANNTTMHIYVRFEDGVAPMAVDDLSLAFDYETLGTEQRIVVRQKTGEIKTLMKRAAQDIIDIGQKLIEVKAELEHGQFGVWLEAEFAWDDRQAQRMMNVAGAFKNDNLSDLKIGASALYLLAAPSTPEAARVDAVQRAQTGEAISHKKAQQIVQQHKPVQPPRIPAPPAPVARVFAPVSAPVTKPPSVTYSKVQDDYVEELPALQVDDEADADWLDNALAGKEADWQSEAEADVDAQLTAQVTTDAPAAATDDDWIVQPFVWTVPDSYIAAAHDVMLASKRHKFLNLGFAVKDSTIEELLIQSMRDVESGVVDEVIALIPVYTDKDWFQLLWQFPICFTNHCIEFSNKNGGSSFKPSNGSAFVYLGPNKYTFRGVFELFGTIVSAMK